MVKVGKKVKMAKGQKNHLLAYSKNHFSFLGLSHAHAGRMQYAPTGVGRSLSGFAVRSVRYAHRRLRRRPPGS